MTDKGEAIQLRTAQGIVIDQVFYNHYNSWPHISDVEALSLKADNLDNHFGENWKVSNLNTLVNVKNTNAGNSDLRFYPNPTTGIVHISGLGMEEILLNVYNLTGVLVKSEMVNSTLSQINIENLNQGIHVVRCGGESQRIVLLK
jgi:hypothetical protein